MIHRILGPQLKNQIFPLHANFKESKETIIIFKFKWKKAQINGTNQFQKPDFRPSKPIMIYIKRGAPLSFIYIYICQKIQIIQWANPKI